MKQYLSAFIEVEQKSGPSRNRFVPVWADARSWRIRLCVFQSTDIHL